MRPSWPSCARQQESQRAELKQLEQRAAQTEADTAAARSRIEALEGSAAALRTEADAKAEGQSRLQEQVSAIGEQIAGLNMKLAGLEAEQEASQKALEELEDLRRDMAGRPGAAGQDDRRPEGKERRPERPDPGPGAAAPDHPGGEPGPEPGHPAAQQREAGPGGPAEQADRESRDKNTELLAMEREVSVLEQKKLSSSMEEKGILDKLWETYELSHEAARQQRVELESVPKAQRRIGELKKSISGPGQHQPGRHRRVPAHQRAVHLPEGPAGRRAEVQEGAGGHYCGHHRRDEEHLLQPFSIINQAFGETFQALFGGGRAALELEDPDDILNCGIEIRVQPPGKALKIISLLSGGEKAFVAIALYFAILKVSPTPFCVMDEIEAALDDANVVRFAHYLRQMSDRTQFIVITHRRGTMEEADVLYGVTMQEQGVSRILTINLNDVERELNIK